mgnify:CR=1 FL=1
MLDLRVQLHSMSMAVVNGHVSKIQQVMLQMNRVVQMEMSVEQLVGKAAIDHGMACQFQSLGIAKKARWTSDSASELLKNVARPIVDET